MKHKHALWVTIAVLLVTLTGCTTDESPPAELDREAFSHEGNQETEMVASPDIVVETIGTLDRNARRKLIVIDAGHGGSDTGAEVRQPDGDYFYEKDINLNVALLLRNLLEAAGGRVFMIRETDEYINHRSRGSIANEAAGDLFISIHCNASDVPAVNGTESWYNEKVDLYDHSLVRRYGISSRRMAQVIQEELLASLGTEDRGIRQSSDLAVLASTEMPAIVIEAAYMSNPGDFKIIQSDGFAETYAVSVAKALVYVMNEAIK